MEVPILKRQVQETPTLLPTPQISGAVPDAFGGQVAEATENLGKTGMNIGETLAKHIQQRNEELRKEKAYNEFNKISRESQELLFSPDIRTIKGSDGKDYDVPTGVLNRMENAANGAVIDYDRQIDTLYKTHTDAMDVDTKYLFDKLFTPHNESLRNRIVEHEAKQRNEAVKQGFYEFRDNTLNTLPLLDEQQKVESIKSVTDRIDELQRSGRFSYDEAEKKKNDFYAEIVKSDIYRDKATQEADSFVLAELEKEKEGKYYFLPESKRTDLKQESQRRIFQNNQSFGRELELSKDTRFNSIFDKINTDTLTLQDIDNEMAIPEEQGGIPKKQLLEIKKGIQSKIKNNLEVITENNDKAKDYLKFVDNFIDDENDRQKAREYLAKAYGDMILSSQEASFLNKIKRETEDIEFSRTSMWLKSAVNAIRETFRGRKTSTDSEAAIAIKQLLSGMSKGKNPNELVKEILYQSAIKKNPILLNIPENGNLSMDTDGNIKIIMPDLTTKETKEGK